MTEDYFSDDSSFYGDSDHVKDLENRTRYFNIQGYWESHDRDLNVRFAKTKPANEPQLPKGDLHNRYDGVEAAWQLHETTDAFISRLPVKGSSWVGPWLWAANPYAERNSEPEDRDISFMQKAPRLLQDYLDQKQQTTVENPKATQGTITRKLKPARDKLKEDILALAKQANMTSGKWMLFPSDDHATDTWKRVVSAVIEGKLGTAAKISTDGSPRLVCVYTKDFTDEDDVKRVVQELEKLKLLPQDPNRSIYYKCDAYTHLDIGSGNEYGLQASLYSSKDVLAGKATVATRAATGKAQKRSADSKAQPKGAGKRKKI